MNTTNNTDNNKTKTQQQEGKKMRVLKFFSFTIISSTLYIAVLALSFHVVYAALEVSIMTGILPLTIMIGILSFNGVLSLTRLVVADSSAMYEDLINKKTSIMESWRFSAFVIFATLLILDAPGVFSPLISTSLLLKAAL